ncbi:MAG: right-handed parallel beta-helix repeat-containing protein, partial [Candidatus Thermoplasmatota archaeon]|nr:right-handed parallel beta-helix repeat-containing protein [Candidatus Thermoplasmatota archaeon]
DVLPQWSGSGSSLNDSNPYTGSYSAQLEQTESGGMGAPSSAYTDPSTGTSSTLYLGDHNEDLTWTATYQGKSHSVNINVSDQQVLNYFKGWWHDSIQDAVDAADPGDVIYVMPGTYYENVVINKPLMLAGLDMYGVIIEGGNTGPGLTIASTSNVFVEGFTVQNSTTGNGNIVVEQSSYCRLEDIVSNDSSTNGIMIDRSNDIEIVYTYLQDNNQRGIYIYQSDSISIDRGEITRNGNAGIYLQDSGNNTIEDSNIYSNSPGDGIHLQNSANNTIQNNAMSGNNNGIYMNSGKNNAIQENSFTSNSAGIYVEASSLNEITKNTFSTNTWLGMYLSGSTNTITRNTFSWNNVLGLSIASGSGNAIYVNNFIGSGNLAEDNGFSNIWNLAKNLGGGNHWSDKTTPDGGDGFTTTGRAIVGSAGSIDNVPWVLQDGWVGEVLVSIEGGVNIRVNTDPTGTMQSRPAMVINQEG